MKLKIFFFGLVLSSKLVAQIEVERDQFETIKIFLENFYPRWIFDWIFVGSLFLLIISFLLFRNKERFYIVALVYYFLLFITFIITIYLDYYSILDWVAIGHSSPEQFQIIYPNLVFISILFAAYSLVFSIILFMRKSSLKS